MNFKVGETTATALMMTAKLLVNENENLSQQRARENGPLFERNTTAVFCAGNDFLV